MFNKLCNTKYLLQSMLLYNMIMIINENMQVMILHIFLIILNANYLHCIGVISSMSGGALR